MNRPIQRAKLRDLGIREFDKPIWEMSKAELIKNFGPGDPYPININVLMRNIIWQVRQFVLAGKIPPIHELERNLWYAFIKIPLDRAGARNTGNYDQAETMVKQIVTLVMDANLMRYKDLQLINDNAHQQRVGDIPNIILVAEKKGHYQHLLNIAKSCPVTIIALGGQPSLLAVEYFVDELRNRNVDLQTNFYVFSYIDWDPAGWIITNSFLADFMFYGISHIHHKPIVDPKGLPKDLVELHKFKITPNAKTRKIVADWLKTTGGINRQLFGLQADAVDSTLLQERFQALAGPYIQETPHLLRLRALRSVLQETRRLAQHRHEQELTTHAQN